MCHPQVLLEVCTIAIGPVGLFLGWAMGLVQMRAHIRRKFGV
jgi:hypothetical protein